VVQIAQALNLPNFDTLGTSRRQMGHVGLL
jgi:hypothetical protein